MENQYKCNPENAMFFDADESLIISKSFMDNGSISVLAKGIYCTLASFQSVEPFGISVERLSKSCRNPVSDIESAISELMKLNLIKAV